MLRVECDPRTVSAAALFPFGLRLPLVRGPRSNLWEGRFLVPGGLKDGRHRVRILIKDAGGSVASESKEGTWRVPSGFTGRVDVLFEAMNQAKNHAFARAALEMLL